MILFLFWNQAHEKNSVNLDILLTYVDFFTYFKDSHRFNTYTAFGGAWAHVLGLLKLGVYPETRISNKTGLQGIVKIGQGSLTNLSVQVLVKTEGFPRTRYLLWF